MYLGGYFGAQRNVYFVPEAKAGGKPKLLVLGHENSHGPSM